MSDTANLQWRFISFEETQKEVVPGRSHFWTVRPGMVDTKQLLFVRAQIEPGQGHHFHYHPGVEEIIYVLSGRAQQFVGKESRLMGPGDTLFIGPDIIHATYNPGPGVLDFLAVLTPPKDPVTIEVCNEEPWRSLWPGGEQKAV